MPSQQPRAVDWTKWAHRAFLIGGILGWVIAIVLGLCFVFLGEGDQALFWTKASFVLAVVTSLVSIAVACLLTLGQIHETKEQIQKGDEFYSRTTERIHELQNTVNQVLVRVYEFTDVADHDAVQSVIQKTRFVSGDDKEVLVKPPGGCTGVVLVSRPHPSWPPPVPGTRWICHRDPILDEEATQGVTVNIRRTFEIPVNVVPGSLRGRLTGRVDDWVGVLINESEVGTFGRTMDEFESDVSAYLRPGGNVVDFHVTNAPAGRKTTAEWNPMGICYRIEIEYRPRG